MDPHSPLRRILARRRSSRGSEVKVVELEREGSSCCGETYAQPRPKSADSAHSPGLSVRKRLGTSLPASRANRFTRLSVVVRVPTGRLRARLDMARSLRSLRRHFGVIPEDSD